MSPLLMRGEAAGAPRAADDVSAVLCSVLCCTVMSVMSVLSVLCCALLRCAMLCCACCMCRRLCCTVACSEGVNVTDCILEDGGHVFQEGCGVLAQSTAGALIAHNIIRNFK